MSPRMLRIESDSERTSVGAEFYKSLLQDHLADDAKEPQLRHYVVSEDATWSARYLHGTYFRHPSETFVLLDLNVVVEKVREGVRQVFERGTSVFSGEQAFPSLGRWVAINSIVTNDTAIRFQENLSRTWARRGMVFFGRINALSQASFPGLPVQELSRPREETENLLLSDVGDISPEAARRMGGHERIVAQVCALAREEAQARGLSVLKIKVRPAWSHEYEERTGVVVDVKIQATADERFSYWDAMCERLDRLEISLASERQRFLNEELSFVVTRS